MLLTYRTIEKIHVLEYIYIEITVTNKQVEYTTYTEDTIYIKPLKVTDNRLYQKNIVYLQSILIKSIKVLMKFKPQKYTCKAE